MKGQGIINAKNPMNGNPINWTDKNQLNSQHQGGAYVLMCDGSVQFLMEGTDVNILYGLATRAGGEPVELPM